MILTITVTPVAFEQHIKSARTVGGLGSLFVDVGSDRFSSQVCQWTRGWWWCRRVGGGAWWDSCNREE